MTFIETVSEEQASDRTAELYEADRARLGYVANYTRAFARRPAVYEAWQALSGAIKETMDLRRYELVTLAAARRLRSSYCALAHGTVLTDRFFEPSALRDITRDPRSSELDTVDVAVMELAEKVVDDATSVDQADIDGLRELGLSDDEIFDVVSAAAVRCFFSKTLDALGVQPDREYASLAPELRAALVVGRPIAYDGPVRDSGLPG